MVCSPVTGAQLLPPHSYRILHGLLVPYAALKYFLLPLPSQELSPHPLHSSHPGATLLTAKWRVPSADSGPGSTGWLGALRVTEYRRPLEESCPADSATRQTESRYLCVTSSVLTIHKKIRTNCQRNNGAWTKCNRGLKEMAITRPGQTCSMGTAPLATLAESHPDLT